MPAVTGIILAAGGSTRLGRPKQLIPFQGQTLLRRTVNTAREAGCDRVLVVVGANADLMRTELSGQRVEIVHNPQWERGIGSSIRLGAASALAKDGSADLFILLCDQPGVSAATLERLRSTIKREGKEVAAASYGGTLGPPVLVTGSMKSKLLSIPDEQGAKSIWIDHPQAVIAIDCPEAEMDVDTADDLKALSLLPPNRL